jgi:2-C-methyl-D-erythritol 4-phosphate cytidylyltransferase
MSPNQPAFHALIPAAGVGARAGGNRPKQYQTLHGKSLLEHTLTAFAKVQGLASLTVVVSEGDGYVDEVLSHVAATAPMQRRFCGGATRAQSVLNGLNDLLATHTARLSDWVLVHDAARCMVQPWQIEFLMTECATDDVGGLLAVPLADTLKRADAGRSVETVHRADKWLAQTPQMFRLGVLRDALMAAGDDVTDEASAIEMLGLNPKLVLGSPDNFKITWPEDFVIAEALLHARAKDKT